MQVCGIHFEGHILVGAMLRSSEISNSTTNSWIHWMTKCTCIRKSIWFLFWDMSIDGTVTVKKDWHGNLDNHHISRTQFILNFMHNSDVLGPVDNIQVSQKGTG